jgi:hypothetical protein
LETQTVSAVQPAARPPHISPTERKAHGKRVRGTVRRDAHTGWRAPADRADPIGALRAADVSRCGWVSARAHAKSGDPWAISGYLGKSAQFGETLGAFTVAYADQAERDHAAPKAAVRAGIIDVQLEH